MKGVVFTEFLDMVEQEFSLEVADDILESSDLASGGVYTAVGTYDSGEMSVLVQALSDRVGIPVPGLLHAYGKALFGRFFALYPEFFEEPGDAFAFLATIDSVIHREVRKLYREAEVSGFEVDRQGTDRLVLVYRSPRHLGDLATGLLDGAVEHFGESIDVVAEPLDADGAAVRFTLTRTAPRV